MKKVLIGVLLSTFIFLPDKYFKNKFRNKEFKEFIDIVKFLCVTSMMLYTLLFAIDLYSPISVMQSGSHLIKSIQVINIFAFFLLILIKKVYKVFYKSNNDKGFLFLIPFINAVLTAIYFVNQRTDFFLKFQLLRNIFKFFKHSDPTSSLPNKITGILLMDNFIVLVYVLIVINNSDNPSIMKHVCDVTTASEDNSTRLLNKKCATEILNDVFFYSLFFKLIVAIVSIIALFFMNRASSSSPIGNASSSIETGAVETAVNTTVT
tara:strand:+ start:1962 stop:2753 length:792 start_codon:yes stop_codon:yes gene_type:complete